jgi:hypothetical protein
MSFIASNLKLFSTILISALLLAVIVNVFGVMVLEPRVVDPVQISRMAIFFKAFSMIMMTLMAFAAAPLLFSWIINNGPIHFTSKESVISMLTYASWLIFALGAVVLLGGSLFGK